jgi:hypothetical protein
MAGERSERAARLMAEARWFYRIVRGRRPVREDFLSARQRGLQPRDQQEHMPVLYDGISVYDTLGRARVTAQAFPRLGRYVAALAIPSDAEIEIHKTLGPGHHTLIGDPDVLLGLVVDVMPVEG